MVVEDSGARYAIPLDHEQMRARITIPDLWAALQVAPSEAISCLALAAHHTALCTRRGKEDLAHLHPVPEGTTVAVRLHNHNESLISFSRLKSNCIGRLVSVRGSVVRASQVKPVPTEIPHRCGKCGGEFSKTTSEGGYVPPTKCLATPSCKGKKFEPLREKAPCKDWQRVRLQEQQGGKGSEEGNIPRALDCELSGGLVDSCKTGDIVTVLGIAKARCGNFQGRFCLTVASHKRGIHECAGVFPRGERWRKSGKQPEAHVAVHRIHIGDEA